jgi:hypothetical protein
VSADGGKTFFAPFDVIRGLNSLFECEVFMFIYPGEVLAFFTGSLAFYGILELNAELTHKAVNQWKLDREAFDARKKELDHYLAIFSILIVFSVLTTAFLNQAIIGHFTNAEKLNIIRTEFVYTYGLIFSVILALIYIPTYQRLLSVTSPKAFKGTDNLSHLSISNFQPVLSILAPLLGGGLSELIKGLS